MIICQGACERQRQETTGEGQAGVVSIAAYLVVPRVRGGGGHMKMEIGGPARPAGVGMGLVFHAEWPDHRGGAQAGLFEDLPQDGLFGRLPRLDAAGRNLGAGLRQADVVEDKELGARTVPDHIGGDTDSGSGHPSIVRS
ncbi:hypothetical protein BJY14_003872 [Actinomadura luteofluorescens]|uniref:Uncharacterized protein n=1 Tax=Actinomadura luteofluorescens TaxID=46163 RepID=A0A7Y9JHZ3_9ACTN|nr:hypothetical protein [Actinomadura luteofluorescens]